MNARQRAAKDKAIKLAMSELIQDPRFVHFIDVLREWKEITLEDACTDRTVANERASMAAIGELRAYKAIISLYDEYVNRTAEDAEPEVGG